MKAKSTRNNHVSLRSPELRNRDMEQLLLRAKQSELLLQKSQVLLVQQHSLHTL